MSQPLPSLADTVQKYGLSAKKSLGQHFLLDEQITGNIAALAGKVEGYTFIEIGPGPGGLTRPLLERGARVIAVEKDERCLEALRELQQAFPDRLTLMPEDAMTLSLEQLGHAPRKLVSNLPYNIGTPLLLNWLEEIYKHPNRCELFTLMFQREVAERIIAEPGSKQYGRLSVITQWLCDVSHQFDLPPEAFSPPPKVHSSVISLIPRAQPLIYVPMQALERVLAAAFGQRRKMLRASLKSLGVDPIPLLEQAGIDPGLRGEVLSVEQFCKLTQIYVRMREV